MSVYLINPWSSTEPSSEPTTQTWPPSATTAARRSYGTAGLISSSPPRERSIITRECSNKWEVRKRPRISRGCLWPRASATAGAARDRRLQTSWMRCLPGWKTAKLHKPWRQCVVISRALSHGRGRYAHTRSWPDTKASAIRITRRVLSATRDFRGESKLGGPALSLFGLQENQELLDLLTH